MPVINKGTALSNGEQLTADKLNDLLDLATFSPTATDSVSTFVNSSGQIAVLDGGIAANKLATNAVTTTKILNANVTKAKLENMSAPLKVLGRTTAGAGAVEEVAILDEDDLVTDSATALATQQSIKAYVDTLFGAAVITESFESAETNIPAWTSGITYSHGLSSFPKIIQVFVKCKVADSGYSVDDEVLIGDYGDAGKAQNAWASSTEIGWGHSYSGSTIIIVDKNANVSSAISSPNWKIYIRAYA
jgi:hypothetical protein